MVTCEGAHGHGGEHMDMGGSTWTWGWGHGDIGEGGHGGALRH